MQELTFDCNDCGCKLHVRYSIDDDALYFKCANCLTKTDMYYTFSRLVGHFKKIPHDSVVVENKKVYHDPDWNSD